MKQTPLCQVLDMLGPDDNDLKDNILQWMIIERQHIIDAFNAGAVKELGLNVHYYDGEDYYEQNYTDENLD